MDNLDDLDDMIKDLDDGEEGNYEDTEEPIYEAEEKSDDLVESDTYEDERPLRIKIGTESGDTNKTIDTTSYATGQDLLLLFAEKMNMKVVPMYFGIAFKQAGYDLWLGLDDTLQDLDITTGSILTFKVRYFKFPKDLPDPVIINLYFRQVQGNIVPGIWPVNEAKGIELAALWLQAQHGNFDPDKHEEGLYAGSELALFVPHRILEAYKDSDSHGRLVTRLFERHSRLRGMTEEEARLKYIQAARNIPTYGATGFNVQVSDKDCVMLVVEEGLMLSFNANHESLIMPDYEYYMFSNIVEFAQTNYGMDFRLQELSTEEGDTVKKVHCAPEMADGIMEHIQDYYQMYMSQEKLRRWEVENPDDDNFADDEYPDYLPPVVIFEPVEERVLADDKVSQLDYFKQLLYFDLKNLPISCTRIIQQVEHAIDHDDTIKTISLRKLHLPQDALDKIFGMLTTVAAHTNNTRKYFVKNMPLKTVDNSLNKNLRANMIEAMVKGIKEPLTVTKVNLSNCNIIDTYGKNIADICKATDCCVQELILDNNKIGTKSMNNILQAIKAGGRIKALSARNNNLGNACMKTLGDIGMSGCPLVNVNFSENEIGDDGVKSFVNNSMNCCEITTLVLNKVSIGERAIKHLSRLLLSKDSKIEKLGVGGNHLNRKCAQIFAEIINNKEGCLTSLNLSFNDFGKKGLVSILDALKDNSKITVVNLGGYNFDQEAAVSFKQLFNDNKNIEVLRLGSCEFPLGTFQSVTETIKTCTVKELELTNNKLTSDDFKSLGETLSVNRDLETLNLAGTADFSFQSMRHFVIPFQSKSNITLKHLILDNCNLGDDGAEKIAALLRLELKMETLSVKSNGITTHGALSLLLAVDENRWLRMLHLDYNNIVVSSKLKQMMGVTNTDLRIGNSGELLRQTALKVNPHSQQAKTQKRKNSHK